MSTNKCGVVFVVAVLLILSGCASSPITKAPPPPASPFAQSITLTPLAATVQVNQVQVYIATVLDQFGHTFTLPAGPGLTFTSLGDADLHGNSLTALSVVGTATIFASYDGINSPTATLTIVALDTQTITFNAPPAPQALATINPSATSSAGLPVVIASLTSSVCSTTKALTIGTCTLEATAAGNSVFAAATPVDVSFNVTGATQTITFPAPTPGPTFTVSATSSSGLPVTFYTNSTACTLNGATVTEVSAGDCDILADQDGGTTDIYAAAPEVSQDITIGQTVTLVSVSPSSATLAPGATQQFTASAFDQFNQPLAVVPTFTWTGSDQTGLYTAVNTTDVNATDTVTASAGGVTSAPAGITITPAPAVLTIVNLAPQTPTINAPNGTANFSITAVDQFGRPYTPAPSCTYTSDNPAAATIGSNGQAVAANTGTTVATTDITAMCGSFTETTLLTVNPPPFLKTLTVAPVTVTAYSATSVPVTATDEYGQPFAISAGQITVNSFNSTYVTVAVAPTTATLNIGGVAAVGSTPVSITVGNVSTTFNVTVNACLPTVCYTPVVTAITVTPETTSMEFNGTQVVAASAVDQHGASMTTTYTWTSDGEFTVDASGNVTAISLGTGTVSAESNGVTGVSASITVAPAPYPTTPVIASLFPPMAVAKTYAGSTQDGLQAHSTSVVVTGTGFLPGSLVCFGADCSPTYTTFKSSTKLVMLVPWQDLTVAGPVNVTVQNPAITGYLPPTASAASVFTLSTQGFVTITFDDGFTTGFAKGTPLFNAQGIKTTQFIITGNDCATHPTSPCGVRSDGYPWGWNNVGCPAASYPLPVSASDISQCAVGVGNPGYINWADVASLAASGNEIAPHTRSHDYLSLESAVDVTGELQGALQDLQYHATAGVDTTAGYTITPVFAYPYGDYGCYAADPAFNSCVTGQFTDQQLGTQVKNLGYRGARTSDAALEGGLKYNELDCDDDSCWSWADQPLYLHTIAADQSAGDTCSFLGNTACDTSSTNGAPPCVDAGVTMKKPGFKCWVDQAVQNGQWVILLFHRVDDNTSSDKSLSVNSTEIQSLALYLKTQGITAVTFRQGLAMEGINGQYEPVDASGNILSFPSPVD